MSSEWEEARSQFCTLIIGPFLTLKRTLRRFYMCFISVQMSYLCPKLAHDKCFFESIHFPIIEIIEPMYNLYL